MEHIPDYNVFKCSNKKNNEDDAINNDFEHRDGDSKYKNTSFNLVTLKELKDVLSELNEYFDEFEVELVSCPNLTKEPYNLNFDGLSANEKIFELYDPSMIILTPETGSKRIISLRNSNYYFSDGRPGMVLKIRAKGRKTNYSIIMLIQSILNERFPFRIGLGGVLVINGGQVLNGCNTKNLSTLKCHYRSCDSALITIGIIINDSAAIIKRQHAKNILSVKCYMFYACSLYLPEIFINDVTPKETEYIGYFNVAEKIIRV